ncbi:MAG: putative O-glycosylation ligase, exosortase A system-associated [Alphaproteobacteria bacterium]|nr:putative O-glycosylation ligase, exosortase A system-associated [Alphaproteobacteria bacterium]
MRSILFLCEMLALLPIVVARPFVGVLIFSFISFSNLHRFTWGFTTGLPWVYVTVILTLIGCVVAREPKRLPINATTLLVLMFLIGITLTSMVALAPFDLVMTKWEAVSKVFFFLLVTAALLTDRYRIHALLWVMVISLGYYGVKGGGFTLLTGGGGRVLGPPSSMIADNNHLAAGLLVTLPIINYLRMQSAHRIVRTGLLAGMILTLFGVIGSYSRGALIGLTAVSFVLWLRSSNKIVTGTVIVVAVVAAVSVMPQEWQDRMWTLQDAQATDSGQSRLAIWHAAWNIAVHRPLVGGGFLSTYTQSVIDDYAPGTVPRAVHSIWFETLGENGFPTFFVWLAISGVAILNTFAIQRESKRIPELQWCRDLARMAQVSIVAYMTAGTFLSLSYWDFYFTFLVVIAATRMLVREEVRKTRQALPGDLGWRPRPLPGMPQPGLALAGRPIMAGQISGARPQGGGVRGGPVAVREAPGRLAAPSRPTTRTGLDG